MKTKHNCGTLVVKPQAPSPAWVCLAPESSLRCLRIFRDVECGVTAKSPRQIKSEDIIWKDITAPLAHTRTQKQIEASALAHLPPSQGVVHKWFFRETMKSKTIKGCLQQGKDSCDSCAAGWTSDHPLVGVLEVGLKIAAAPKSVKAFLVFHFGSLELDSFLASNGVRTQKVS